MGGSEERCNKTSLKDSIAPPQVITHKASAKQWYTKHKAHSVSKARSELASNTRNSHKNHLYYFLSRDQII